MSAGRVVATRAELRAALGDTAPGLVPTMGALHDGHLALIARAATENLLVVVSVFVNPTQFSDPDDFARYPRDPARDVAAAFAAGAGIVFTPEASAIYPPGAATRVEVAGPALRWEGAVRPGHFIGVATVVTILLDLVRPARSYFGEKDYQQLQVIRRLHADLALPGEIIGCPTVRDADGLALSSRNARLSPEARRAARAIPDALQAMVERAGEGETEVSALIATGEAVLRREPALAIDHLVVVDGISLEPLTTLTPGARALIAVELDGVRLIDNRELRNPRL
ncbi:MAG: pantoate--beta-alanine ligase [Thermomicrobiales bacterium]|nr:pantoate--beta-alanine ligase [Thermomicrobiales bacterium]